MMRLLPKRTPSRYVVKVYAGQGWRKEREARGKMSRGIAKMAEKGYRVHSTAVGNSKGTFARWQRFEIVVTYELAAST